MIVVVVSCLCLLLQYYFDADDISTAYHESAKRMEISTTNEGYQLAIDDCGCGKLSVFVVAVLL